MEDAKGRFDLFNLLKGTVGEKADGEGKLGPQEKMQALSKNEQSLRMLKAFKDSKRKDYAAFAKEWSVQDSSAGKSTEGKPH